MRSHQWKTITWTIALACMLNLGLLSSGTVLAGQTKVDICHLPPGNPDNWHTIRVSENALPAHLAHGDYDEATCLENCEPLCSDEDACTQDVPAEMTECMCLSEPRPPVDCDDSSLCTTDICDSVEGCEYTDTVVCDPGEYCGRRSGVCDQCVHGHCEPDVLPILCVCNCDTGWTGDFCELPN